MADTPNQWGTMTFEVPDLLQDLREDINSVAEFLVAVLDVALLALQLVKAFLVGFLNPIAALVQAILDEIRSLLRDLKQLGLYLTGDWKLTSYPYTELQGGFSEYERRMIGRLTDHTDPTRPDVSSKTKVLSMFFYLSVDVSDIERLLAFISALVRYFNQTYDTPGSLPTPVITKVLYGNAAASILHPQDLPAFFKYNVDPPSIAQVKWVLSTAPKHPFNPFPPLPPKGFLVTVSTIEPGISICWDRPQNDSTLQENASGVGRSQPREANIVRLASGRPLVLHGGAAMIQGASTLAYNQGTDSNGAGRDVTARLFGMVSPTANEVIPLDMLTQGDVPVFQQTFFVPLAGTLSQWATSEYSIDLKLEDMPQMGKVTNDNGQMKVELLGPAGTYYVRVATCTREIGNGTKQYKYNMVRAQTGAHTPGRPITVSLGDDSVQENDLSPFSAPFRVAFPNANTMKYLEAVKAALVALALSRPDLTPLDQLRQILPANEYNLAASNKLILNGVAAQRCLLEPFKHLLGWLFDDYMGALDKASGDPGVFRTTLYDKIQTMVATLYDKTGPQPEMEAYVVQNTQALRTATWKQILSGAGHEAVSSYVFDVSILESINPGSPAGRWSADGLALSPYQMGIPAEIVNDMFWVPGLITERAPQMQEGELLPPEGFEFVFATSSKELTAEVMSSAPPPIRRVYEKYIQNDGTLLLPNDLTPYLEGISSLSRKVGSADKSPVFYIGATDLTNITRATVLETTSQMGVFYARGLLAKYDNGSLLQQAALALGIAGAALSRSPADGAWLNVRLLDWLPGLENFLAVILNWIEAIRNAIQSIIDTIRKYIEFIEGRIVELQNLIRRINDIIQSILGFAFQIPKCAVLTLVSDGTIGVLSDLVSAQNKPSDSPLAYGAGIAVVIPFGPAFGMDIIAEFCKSESGNPTPDTYMASSTPPFPAMADAEVLPPPVPPDPEPDVL